MNFQILSSFPDDILFIIANNISKPKGVVIIQEVLYARTVCVLFAQSIPYFRLRQLKLGLSLETKIAKEYCINDYCYYDSYLPEYAYYAYYQNYIHDHQKAINTIVIRCPNVIKFTSIHIPYCLECMRLFTPILLAIDE